MEYGLCNAPSTFQRFINEIFADLIDAGLVIYIDDLLIYSDDKDTHKKTVSEVLQRLHENGLYCKLSKCHFYEDTVEYLGYILSPSGLAMDDNKVKTILEWPEPKKIKDIQSFLGFCNFYRRFIPEYSGIVVPLTRLTRKNVPWNFDASCRQAFEKLKSAFTAAPILASFVPGLPLVVETDASDYAIAGILSTYPDDGTDLHPIAFFSRTLSGAELNYDVHDKELLAIFEAFKT
jgi:hypothetical protein